MAEPHSIPGTVVVVASDGMGDAPPELRRKLVRDYLKLLLNFPPDAICFYGSGVRLVAEGSEVLDILNALEEKGALLLSCATSINHFGLAEKVKVGVLGGMQDIVAAQSSAHKVITLG